MNKFLVFLVIGLLGLSNCSKAPKKWTVKYQLLNVGKETPVYRVRYLLQNGSVKLVGPINTYNWESEELPEFESGSPASVEIEIISGKGTYQLIILRDGAFHEREVMPENSPSFKIEANI
tara:strand:+ start:103691 stop:104050 length:360 start_codon:yes stop_codon:yes gene_type:complete